MKKFLITLVVITGIIMIIGGLKGFLLTLAIIAGLALIGGAWFYFYLRFLVPRRIKRYVKLLDDGQPERFLEEQQFLKKPALLGGKSNTTNYCSLALSDAGRHEEAAQLLLESIQKSETKGSSALTVAYFNICTYYLRAKKLDKAKFYFNEAHQESEKVTKTKGFKESVRQISQSDLTFMRFLENPSQENFQDYLEFLKSSGAKTVLAMLYQAYYSGLYDLQYGDKLAGLKKLQFVVDTQNSTWLRVAAQKVITEQTEPDPRVRVQQAIDKFLAEKKPSLALNASRAEITSLTDSKFGGDPYLPMFATYPENLKLLAQLNFEELPHLENFPETGILQFFILPDDLYGADFDDPTRQGNFQVRYYANILPDSALQHEFPQVPEEEGFPFEGQFKLTGQLESQSLTITDYQAEKCFEQFDDEELRETIYNRLADGDDGQSVAGHRLGGFPYFTQTDPRHSGDGFDTVLLQIDSQHDIMWGDSGIANFFINSEDLKNKDFSRVLYNWDCY